MRQSLKSLVAFLCLNACLAPQIFSQVFENNYVWHNQSHAAWKIEAANPFGYVIAGNKYFSSPNTAIYITSFDEFGTHLWTRSHESGLTSLQSFWKSFVKSPDGSGYFVVSAGEQGGHKAYALLVNTNGMKLWDRISALPSGIEFGGVTTSVNGGFIATGATNNGKIAVVKFDPYGNLQWSTELPVNGYGWTIAQAVGGGYIIAGGMQAVKVDPSGNLEWSTAISLPPSPSGAYTYGEFEEIKPLPDGTGFVVTGSCFSNSHSGIYTARVSYAGSVAWAKVNDAVNTSGAGTPVAWVNNAIIDGYGSEIVTSWRRGPVSAGGTMYYQRMNLAGTNIGTITSLGNTIPVREAFMTKAHGKYVVGGTRGNLASAYSYVNASLPAFKAGGDDRSEPLAETFPLLGLQTNTSNAHPEFELPPVTSRQFAAKFRVFPNPSTGYINVGGAIEPGALLRVISPMGKVVMERRIQAGELLIQLDLGNLATGLYIVEMTGDSGATSQKIVVE